MKVDIQQNDEVRLAVVEHHGDPKLVEQTLDRLIGWAKSRPENLVVKGKQSYGIAYNDPGKVPADDFRMDFGVAVPKTMKLDDGVVEACLPAGRYAKAVHEGSHANIADTVYHLYRDWLPASGEKLGDLPVVFRYINFAHEVPETALRTEVSLLLKD